jgi:hypothetical protein
MSFTIGISALFPLCNCLDFTVREYIINPRKRVFNSQETSTNSLVPKLPHQATDTGTLMEDLLPETHTL